MTTKQLTVKNFFERKQKRIDDGSRTPSLNELDINKAAPALKRVKLSEVVEDSEKFENKTVHFGLSNAKEPSSEDFNETAANSDHENDENENLDNFLSDDESENEFSNDEEQKECPESPKNENKNSAKKPASNKLKKRGFYKKRKMTPKESFINSYVTSEGAKDTTHTRKYQNWLIYDKEQDKLFCKLCIAAKEIGNEWGNSNEGCSIFTKKSLDQHLNGKGHFRAIEFENLIANISKNNKIEAYFKKNDNLNQNNEIQSSNSNMNENYRNLFLNVYWACKEEIAILKILSLHDYTKNQLNVPIPEYHKSMTTISEKIIPSIAKVIQNKILREVEGVNSVGIMIDESKDISDKEILLMYLRYYSESAKMTREAFVALFELKHTDAETIYLTIKNFMEKEKMLKKLKFVCSDGAPAMASRKEGVAGKLLKDLPKLLSFHCICHQESLALRHTYNILQNYRISIEYYLM